MAKPNIWIVRHGERIDETHQIIEWLINCKGRKFDPPLTNTGKRQATVAGATLRELFHSEKIRISRVYSSPLTRAVQTAQQIAEVFDLPITIVFGFAECAASIRRENNLPMLSPTELRDQFGITRIQESRESPRTFFDTIEMLSQIEEEEDILIVCHREGIRDLARKNNLMFKKIPYCSIAKFETNLTKANELEWMFCHFFSREGKILHGPHKNEMFSIEEKKVSSLDNIPNQTYEENSKNELNNGNEEEELNKSEKKISLNQNENHHQRHHKHDNKGETDDQDRQSKQGDCTIQ